MRKFPKWYHEAVKLGSRAYECPKNPESIGRFRAWGYGVITNLLPELDSLEMVKVIYVDFVKPYQHVIFLASDTTVKALRKVSTGYQITKLNDALESWGLFV